MATRPLPYLARGDLDQEITIRQPVYNSRGDQIESWADVATVFAAVEPYSPTVQHAGQDLQASDRIVNRQQVVFRFDFNATFTTPMRIVHLGTEYDIESLTDLNSARIQMQARGEAVL